MSSTPHFLNPNIKNYELPFSVMHGYDLSVNITENFTFQELYDATKVMPVEMPLNHIPLHKNAIEVAQYLRTLVGVPLNIGSAYRSPLWEATKGRPSTGAHPNALAIDLNTDDKSILINLLYEAFQTKNIVYKRLVYMGVNSFGFYDWGVHLDFRKRKQDNTDRFWDYRKKKNNNYFYFLIFLIPLLLAIFKNKSRFSKLKRIIKKS